MVFEIITGAFLLVILLLLIAMAVGVYRDAKQNEAEAWYAFGWAVLTFLSGLFGILLYLTVERLHLVDELSG